MHPIETSKNARLLRKYIDIVMQFAKLETNSLRFPFILKFYLLQNKISPENRDI